MFRILKFVQNFDQKSEFGFLFSRIKEINLKLKIIMGFLKAGIAVTIGNRKYIITLNNRNVA